MLAIFNILFILLKNSISATVDCTGESVTSACCTEFPHCTQCNEVDGEIAASCSQCDTGNGYIKDETDGKCYFDCTGADESKTCCAADSHCEHCSDGTNCAADQCSEGYELVSGKCYFTCTGADTSTATCCAADSHCEHCSDGTNCAVDQCSEGYELVSGKCYFTCTGADTSTATCCAADSHCEHCLDGTNCAADQCSEGYELVSGKCYFTCTGADTSTATCCDTNSHCQKCLDGTHCATDQCQINYMLQDGQCVALECSKATDNEKKNTCCSVEKCETCTTDSVTTCATCTDSLTVDPISKICVDANTVICNPGITTGCCADAEKNCLTCGTEADSENCASCKIGFMLDSSDPKQCVKIQCDIAKESEKLNTCCAIDHCLSCDDTTVTTCADCGTDYLLEGGKCLTKLSVTIQGEAKVGVTLEAVVSPAEAANLVDYQWKSDGENLQGATSKTLELAAQHETHKISVTITIKAGTEGYQSTATSDQTAAVIPDDSGNTPQAVTVSISGTAKVGEILTAAVNPSEASTAVDYQWYADDIAISGATSSTYELTENEKGKVIHVTVTVKDGNTDYTGSATSTKTAAVAAGGSSETPQAVTVSISGTAKVGQTLRANVSPSEASNAVNYQWYADDTAISGETSSTYVPTKDVEGKKIHVTVTVKDGNTQYTGPASSTKTAAVTPASDNGCNSQVLNCEQCSDTDDSYCIKCEDKYGLRGGYCTKCGDDLFVSVDQPCKYDCATIKNCETEENRYCTVENGVFYCTECIDGYYPSEDKKSCIKIPYPPFSCSLYYPGCTKCNEDQECEDCNTDAHWTWNEDKTHCICQTGYEIYNENQCLEKFNECDPNSNCEECLGPNKICHKCKQGFGLKDGKCTECGDGLFYSQYSPCLITNCPDKNCEKCTNHNNAEENYCYNCKEGFTDRVEGHYDECINETTVDCNNVFGCKKCYAGTNICYECDDALNMTNSNVFPGTCVCKVDFDFVDKKCVRPTGPYVQPDVDRDTLQDIQLTGNNGDYKLESEPTIDNGKKGYFLFDKENDKSVTIEDKYGNIPYYFEIANNVPEFTVSVPENTVTDLKCSGTTLKLPHKNSININGGGDLTLNTIDDNKELTINTVTIQRDLDELTFKSTNANITVKDLDISGTKTCNGQEPGDNFYQTVCNLLRVEAESVFTPTNLKFNRIRAGLNSVINIGTESNVDLTGAPIDLYHAINQFGNQNAPLVFTGTNKINGNTGEIHILNLKKGEQVPVPNEEEENFTVAQFDLTGQNNKDACEEMKKNFKGGEGFSNDKSTCDEYEEGKYRLIATKSSGDDGDGGEKKKKLSGGAIAGIVIACVVVVAAIIALLVYFLVIKKKNQSTTSTQGDSSIAI